MEEDIKVLEEFIRIYKELNEKSTDFYFNKAEIPIEIIENLIKRNKELEETNSKYENGEIFSSKQIKLIEKGVKMGAEVAINKEMENFISKRKLQELLDIDEIGVVHYRIKKMLGDD